MSVAKVAIGSVGVGSAEPLFPAATRHGRTVYLSGQAPLDPVTRGLAAPDFVGQARFVLQQVASTLETAGTSLADVLRVEAILADASHFPAWNELFAEHFPAPRPARTTFVAGFVVPGMLLELQVTAGV